MRSIPLENVPNTSTNSLFKPVPVDLPGAGGDSGLEERVDGIELGIGSPSDSATKNPPTVYSTIKKTASETRAHSDQVSDNIETRVDGLEAITGAMTAAQAADGTSTTQFTISPKVLADEISRRLAEITTP